MVMTKNKEQSTQIAPGWYLSPTHSDWQHDASFVFCYIPPQAVVQIGECVEFLQQHEDQYTCYGNVELGGCVSLQFVTELPFEDLLLDGDEELINKWDLEYPVYLGATCPLVSELPDELCWRSDLNMMQVRVSSVYCSAYPKYGVGKIESRDLTKAKPGRVVL